MKKIAVLLALMLVSVTGFAQDKSKAELRAQRKAERIEEQRVQDSIFQAQQAEYERAYKERMMKEGATTLLVKTMFESRKEILDLMVHSMITFRREC